MSEREIFTAARDIADPAARAAYLDTACVGDAALRGRVEALLRADARPDSLLDVPAVAPPDPAPAPTRAFHARGGAAPGDGPTRPHREDADGDTDDALDFLAPAGRPDALGRVGHYEVLEVLGRGGFGVVYRAFDDMLQRVVAVKVLAPSLAATSPARKRFLREARSAAPIRHENVVRVFETGEEPLPYLVMEFVPGETLQDRLDRTGPLEAPEALALARQAAAGLAAAHEQGLIHRDIKPSNILIDSGSRQVKITDFGLARAADDASLTRSGTVAGTPMYMAPEQAKGEALDHRADLFGLGSVLYTMLTGRPPFRAETTLAVLKRVAEDTPRPMREVIPEVPEWLCRIVERLHAKKPDERFRTAREVADVLADCERQLQAHGALKDYSRIPGGKPAAPQWTLPRPIVAAAALVLLVTTVLLNQFELSSEHTRHRSALMGVLISVIAVGVSQHLGRPDEAGTPTRRRSRVPVWAVLVCTAVSTLTAAAVWPESDLEDLRLFLIVPLALAALVSLILAWVTGSRHPPAGSETPAAPRVRFRHWKRAAAVIVLVPALAGGTYAAAFALRYANDEGKVSLFNPPSSDQNVLVRRDGEVVATLGWENPSVHLASGEYELEAVCPEAYEVGSFGFRISRLFEGSRGTTRDGPVVKLTVRRGDTTRIGFTMHERGWLRR
jgi:serine/threonine protein kinase